jgi:uncharacterized protein (DUF433 family)
MDAAKTYVRKDNHGVFRGGDTRISLDSVVYAYRRGCSAESIQHQYPGLCAEEVYGAIAFYLANQGEVDEYLERQEKVWDEFRRKADENLSPVVERLRAMRSASEKENE